MKKPTLICAALLAFAFVSCNEDVEEFVPDAGDIDLELTPSDKPNAELDTRVFEVLNLDYPGLEKAKAHHEAGENYLAAAEILKYYRNRSGFENPDVDLITTTASASDINMANQALEYRFYIRNFQESTDADGNAIYYNFKQGDAIDWSYKPAEIQDQEFSSQIHRLQWMFPQARAYRVTGNEDYVKNWIEVYGDWIKTFPCPNTTVDNKNLPWHGLQPTERAKSQIDYMPLFIQSENFTPEWLTTFLCALSDEIEMVRMNYYDDTSNIYLSQVQTVTEAGILMPEFKNAATWLADGSQRMSASLDNQFFADGVHNEFDLSYHMGVVDNFYYIYRLASLNGALSNFPSNYVEKLRSACHFFMDMIYPNYTMDNFNDTRAHAKSVIVKNLKKYAEMFPDEPEFAWMAYEGRMGTKPTGLVQLYKDGGYYMLRNGWDAASTMMIVKNNTNAANKWHCQPDNMTFSLYRNGRNFLPDAGVYSYGGTSSSNADRRAYAASCNHNTITKARADFDGNHRNGRFLKHETKGNTELLVIENENYSDLTHRRAIFFVDRTFFVIVDDAYGTADNTVNLNMRLCPAKNDVIIDENDIASFRYGAHTNFADGNNMAFATFSETTDGFAASNNTAYISEKIGEKTYQRRVYQVDVHKAADKAARFITVIAPFATEADFNALGIDARFTDSGFSASGASVEVSVSGKKYELSYQL